MTPTWDGPPQPAPRALTFRDRMRIVRRAVPVSLVILTGLAALLLIRLVERPLCGMRRPVTPTITRGVCIASLRLMGLRRDLRGTVMCGTGALVANHSSWLDILALNASRRIYFVSKSEVAGWPGIGWLARATGTLFIRRETREAGAQKAMFEDRLRAGHRLLFFPEGTSTDGRRVLPFKTTLFAAFFSPGLPDMQVQPVTIRYVTPEGESPEFYGWWGDRDLSGSLIAVLAQRRQGWIGIIYHPPLRVRDFADRKALARAAEAAVRGGLGAEGGGEIREAGGGILG